MGVVYEILLTHGKVYIGQTYRRINDRLRENAIEIKSGTLSHFSFIVKDCNCAADLRNAKIGKNS